MSEQWVHFSHFHSTSYGYADRLNLSQSLLAFGLFCCCFFIFSLMMKEGFVDKKLWMKLMKWSLGSLALALCVFGGCQYFNKQLGMENDNMFEEQIENVIEHHTGLDLDLTPEDPEN